MKHKIFSSLINFFLKILGSYRNGLAIVDLVSQMQPKFLVDIGSKKISFFTPNRLTRWRAETLFTKEPETIQWIDGFEESGCFFDVGANVGIYSIYAGITRPNLRVFAFEPTFFNYFILNKNIALNNLESGITALPVALSNQTKQDYLFIPDTTDGAAQVNFGNNLDFNKNAFKQEFKQGALAYSLDDIIETFKLPTPKYLKIDVDGLELEIIEGADKLLKNQALKSVLIELNENLPGDMKIRDILLSSGFLMKEKRQSPMFSNSQFKNVFNYIFERSTSQS